MRKRISYLLLFSFILYNLGFYIFYFTIDYKIDKQWEAKVVNEDASRVYKISYQLDLPYMSSVPKVKKLNYGFQMNGVYFRVINESFHNGTVEVSYVLDKQKNKLVELAQSWGVSHGLQGFDHSNSKISLAHIKDFLKSEPITLSKELSVSDPTNDFNYYLKTKIRFLEAPPSPPPIYS